MSDTLNLVYSGIDEQNSDKSAATRRQLVAGAAATLGGMGLLGVVDDAEAKRATAARHKQDPQELLNVAATAEVAATIINTLVVENSNRLFPGDAVTQRNFRAAAREELIHYQVLTSRAIGAKPVTKRIWLPNAILADRTATLNAVEVGDTVFINAYLLATTVFGNRGNGMVARIAAEFMGVEAVHRALARQSNGKLGNDRVFMRYSQREDAADSPAAGTTGFRTAAAHVSFLESRGIGFGKEGAQPGAFYEFDAVSARTPDDPGLSTRAPR
jgi:hypothetical protein